MRRACIVATHALLAATPGAGPDGTRLVLDFAGAACASHITSVVARAAAVHTPHALRPAHGSARGRAVSESHLQAVVEGVQQLLWFRGFAPPIRQPPQHPAPSRAERSNQHHPRCASPVSPLTIPVSEALQEQGLFSARSACAVRSLPLVAAHAAPTAPSSPDGTPRGAVVRCGRRRSGQEAGMYTHERAAARPSLVGRAPSALVPRDILEISGRSPAAQISDSSSSTVAPSSSRRIRITAPAALEGEPQLQTSSIRSSLP